METPVTRLPSWTLALAVLAVTLVAVLGHFPAATGFFFRGDWTLLSDAVHADRPFALEPRSLFRGAFAPLFYQAFGLTAAAYKTLSLVLWGVCSLLTLRIALRLGQGPIGALVAGLVTASTPLVVIPIFWWSASSQILAATLALAALDRWLAGGFGAAALGVLLAIAAAFTNESALGVGAVLAASWALGLRPFATGRSRIAVAVLAGVAALLACALAVGLWLWTPHAGSGPYPTNEPRELLLRVAACGGWLVTPGRFAAWQDPLLACLGTLVWAAGLDLAARRWSLADRSVALALVWALVVVIAAAAPARDLLPFHLVLAVPAVGWAVGALVGPTLESALRRRAWPTFAAVVVAALAFASFGATFGATVNQLHARDSLGRPRNPDVTQSRMARSVQTTVDSLAWDVTPCLCVYTPREPKLPPDAPAERQARILQKVSPVYVALEGRTGLDAMLPDSVTTHWRLDLDDVEGECQVLLDRGKATLRSIGTVDNTRLTLAMQAVNLGRHEEAMDLLLVVLGEGGKKIHYEYDSQAIGLSLSRLELMAPSFVEYLDDDGGQPAQVVRDLFLQMFAFVMGLLEEPEPTDGALPETEPTNEPVPDEP